MSTGPATRNFRNTLVRVADLTVVEDFVEGYTFSNCEIVGPAVVAFLGGTVVSHCSFDSPGQSALFWPIAPSREVVLGAVAFVGCHFSGCSFRRIGLALPEDEIEQAAAGIDFSG